MWGNYQRKGLSEMRPVTTKEIDGNFGTISISSEDYENGSPLIGDMIARNPKNHNDQWLVAKKYFEDNLELATNDNAIEAEIQTKGLTAPRITPEDVDNAIIYAEYSIVTNTTCTICSAVLQNGYVVIGKSAAASKENFDKSIGERIALGDVKRQIWALEGYLLKQKLFESR